MFLFGILSRQKTKKTETVALGVRHQEAFWEAGRVLGRRMGERRRRKGHGRTQMWNVNWGVTQMVN